MPAAHSLCLLSEPRHQCGDARRRPALYGQRTRCLNIDAFAAPKGDAVSAGAPPSGDAPVDDKNRRLASAASTAHLVPRTAAIACGVVT
jgi:hypothetical protein